MYVADAKRLTHEGARKMMAIALERRARRASPFRALSRTRAGI